MGKVTELTGTQAIVEVIEQLARDRDQFTSDDIRPLLPANANVLQIPAAVQLARRQGIVKDIGRVNSAIPERKGSQVPVFVAGPTLDRPVPLEPSEIPMSYAEELIALRAYLEKRGHLISIEELATFLVLSASRGWTILAGPSGTGKSSIVRLLADAFAATFIDIQVKRHWTSSDEALGYYSETAQSWIPGPIYNALIAAEDGNKLHFIRFDEMNLAPPEYYAAELLSAGETWIRRVDQVTSASIQLPPIPLDKAPLIPRLTNAVMLFGTANIDETTQPLSPKMLDRSAVITFDQVDFASLPQVGTWSRAPVLQRLTSLIHERPRSLPMLGDQLDDILAQVAPLLMSIDNYTAPLGHPLGYRPRDGLLTAMSLWRSMEIDEVVKLDSVVDASIRAMILPRLQGSALGMDQYLRGIAGLLIDDGGPATEYTDAIRDRLAQAKYPRSAEKVVSMIDQLTSLGYFGFW